MRKDATSVSDHEHRPHCLPFPPLTANFHCQINDGLERFQRHTGFELTEISSGESPQVLVQPDKTDGIQHVGFETAVHDDDAVAGRQELLRHAAEQGLGQTFDHRYIGAVQWQHE